MKILITGAKGLLGTDLYRILTQEHEITGIDVEQADITIPGTILHYLGSNRFNLIIHCAAYTDVDGSENNSERAFLVNGIGTKHIAQYTQSISAELMYISTDFVFDGQKEKPYSETDVPNPINIYGKSKLEGEKYLQELISQYYIVRTSWLFGKHGKNFVDTILAKANAGQNLRIVNDQFGSPTYSVDLAEAIKHLIKTHKYGIYHVSNSGICSWYEFACKILKIKGLNSKVEVVPISSDELGRPAPRPKYSKLASTKYELTTGKSLRSWQDAVKEYITTADLAD